MFETIEYCARAVVRHLNGDMDLFKCLTLEKLWRYTRMRKTWLQ